MENNNVEMVSEGVTVGGAKIYIKCETNDKDWLSKINNSKPACDENNYSDGIVKAIVSEVVLKICDKAVLLGESAAAMARDRKLHVDERCLKKQNRRASIVEDQLYKELDTRRHRSISLVEEINHKPYPITETLNPEIDRKHFKRKKHFSFSFLTRKSKKDEHEEHSENYDEFDASPKVPIKRSNTFGLGRSKKYASALELNNHKSTNLTRSTSLFKKIAHFGEESKNMLKRSMSFRDVSKHKSKENITEAKEQEWRQSLISLVENDTNVSYSDLSFVDYNALNTFNYTDTFSSEKRPMGRTQSMNQKKSPESKRLPFTRGISVNSQNPLPKSSRLANQSNALSLPTLHHLSQDINPEIPESANPRQRYRRRPQSISSEDGRYRTQTESSFRATGRGGARLKVQNTNRQRNINLSALKNKDDEVSVRSRSLNHLDTLEMRQGVISSDLALKNFRSQPNCTRPLLAPPSLTPELLTPTKETPPVRKHMLSKSQKSSSECFVVTFEVGDESTRSNELLLVAQRGITLHESLMKMCNLRNIDLSQCVARLLDKELNTETFLLFSQDTGSLVGKHVLITEKEQGNKKRSGSFYGNHSRKQLGSYRPRTSTYFSASTEEPAAVSSSSLSLHETDQSKKQIKQRLTSFFGAKDTKYDALVEQLNKYNKQGIPNSVSYPKGQCQSVDALYNLEENWKDIVDYSDLNERQQQQQTALWELITSEISYIKTLKVVTDRFLACLRDLQAQHLLKEIDREKLFSNITEILDSNVVFWRNTLFPLVRDMRQYKRTACIENMLEGFSSLCDTFTPYYKYCSEQSRCQHYCRENLDSEVFSTYLIWCESQKDCNRLRLMDILVQPMQRLTKYGLLLKAILKHTDEDVEMESLISMIKMVDDFVINVNSSLKHKQDSERLKGIIARIESYDIVDSKDDDIEKILKKEKNLLHLDLSKPMLNCPPERKRHLLMEGDLKLKDNTASKMEVHCFLLTDMLLLCKPSTKKGGSTMRVIRQPYLVDRMVVSELNRETPSLSVIYKNEFEMAIAAFILQINDAKKLKSWKDGITKAQNLYSQAKQYSFNAQDYDGDFSIEGNLESDHHNLLAPRSPHSSRASRTSSLAHSHSGSFEMNDQSSIGSGKDRGVSLEAENRTGSISSDEGFQPLLSDKSVSYKHSKSRLINKTPNTLSVESFHLGQSLPNLTLGSPNFGSLTFNQNTLLVPSSKNGGHLSPTHRGISYPPPSPTRGNLRRGLAISQNKNPPLIKTRHISSAASSQLVPASLDFDVPAIAGVSHTELCESFSRGHHRQASKRTHRQDQRYHTASIVDDIKKNDDKDSSIYKRLSWNCGSPKQSTSNESHI